MQTIDFVLTPAASGHRVIDPATFPDGDDFGGGCRAGFMGLVRAMGRRGDYGVRAVSTFNAREQEVGGVTYVRLDRQPLLSVPDVVLAYYDTGPLCGSKAALRIASHHTLIPHLGAWDWTDVNTAPCGYAMRHLQAGFDPKGTWAVLPNAVEGLDGVVRAPVAGRVVYHTSPDRGLHELLSMWTAIREHVPHATLHVAGDVTGLCEAAGVQPRSPRGRMVQKLREGLRAAQAAGGVTLLGHLRRPDLLRELSEAAVFAFPASVLAPCETWSTSVLECCAIGVPVVLAPVDALASLWDPYVRLTPAPVEEHRSAFVSELVRMLLDREEAQWLAEIGRKAAARFTFDKAADALDGIIRSSAGFLQPQPDLVQG